MVGTLGHLVAGVLEALQALGYPGIAAIVGLESTGIPLPGETTLITASYLAATGHLSLPLVIGSAAIGAVLGDSLGYAIGRKGGRSFLEQRGKWLGVTPEKLTKADHYFARHGAKTVFFGRFVAFLRILAGPLAGASKMPYRRFLVANVAGAVTWATTMGTLAFFFGKPVAAILSSMGVWALVALTIFLVARFVAKYLHTRRTRIQPPHPTILPGVNQQDPEPDRVLREVKNEPTSGTDATPSPTPNASQEPETSSVGLYRIPGLSECSSNRRATCPAESPFSIIPQMVRRGRTSGWSRTGWSTACSSSPP